MKRKDFFTNIKGLNLTDSPFMIDDSQGTLGSYNYDYLRTGGLSKRRGHSTINPSPLSPTYTLGMGTHSPVSGIKTLLRAAGTQLQTMDITAGTATAVAEDTATSITDFFTSGSVQPVVIAPFNTPLADMTWCTGGGVPRPIAYTNGKVTRNGVKVPTGTFTGSAGTAAIGAPSGTFITTGTYFYALALHKLSTNTLSNATLDTSVAVASTTQVVTLVIPTVSDATKYDQYFVYRSAVAGFKGFTTGDLVGKVPVATTSFIDTGTAIVTTTNIPRSGGLVIDNSELPLGSNATLIVGDITYTSVATGIAGNSVTITYTAGGTAGSEVVTVVGNSITVQLQSGVSTVTQVVTAVNASAPASALVVATGSSVNTVTAPFSAAALAGAVTYAYNSLTVFKQRLITAANSTIYFSDLNKPESWPIANTITIPTGGPITGLAVIGYNAYFSGTTDEYLVIFKEREIWVVTGSGPSDWSLKFIDATGCVAQRLAVSGNGYVAWIDYRGIYIWSGSGKPNYISRPIEALFAYDGDLDKKNLILGWGKFYRKANQIIWLLSHRTYGVQKIAIKLDLRLTLPQATETLDQKVTDGVFAIDTQPALYAGESFIPTNQSEELLFAADISGNVYKMYFGLGDGASNAMAGIDFNYITRDIEFGEPTMAKRIHKVIVYVDEYGPWNLGLDYWSDYKVGNQLSSTNTQPISKSNQISASLWDVGFWDFSYWDMYQAKVSSITYNIDATRGNNEGDAFRFRFYNGNASQPIVMHGFSIYYEEIGLRK